MVIFILFTENILREINRFCESCQRFISERNGFFKMLFIILFFAEQGLFLYILNKHYDISKDAGIFISIFALIVVLTASFQAFIWEYKYTLTERARILLKNSLLKLSAYREWVDKYLRIKSKKK
tara:strand:- start:2512 stop:2883 length:372 start_codon:yes stop_codon:yes gene_type:complete